MNETSKTIVQEDQSDEPSSETTLVGFDNAGSFKLLQRVSNAFAASTLVPKDYRNKPSNCMIAINIAQRMLMDPLTVMQSLHIIYGRASWSAQFLTGMFNSQSGYSNIEYDFDGTTIEDGDNWSCRAITTDLKTGKKIVGPVVSIGMAKAQGWYDRRDKETGAYVSKWRSMPEMMLMYRSATYLTRMYAPQICQGMLSEDESLDVGPAGDGFANAPFAERADKDIPDPVIPDRAKTNAIDDSATENKKPPRKPRRTKQQMAFDKAAEDAKRAEAAEAVAAKSESIAENSDVDNDLPPDPPGIADLATDDEFDDMPFD